MCAHCVPCVVVVIDQMRRRMRSTRTRGTRNRHTLYYYVWISNRICMEIKKQRTEKIALFRQIRVLCAFPTCIVCVFIFVFVQID